MKMIDARCYQHQAAQNHDANLKSKGYNELRLY